MFTYFLPLRMFCLSETALSCKLTCHIKVCKSIKPRRVMVLSRAAATRTVGSSWQCLSLSNDVIAGTRGQNKCVCLNIPRLQFQSPPHERLNNGEGWKLKKPGFFQINKHESTLNRAATEQPDWFSGQRPRSLSSSSSSLFFSSSSSDTKQSDVVNTNNNNL